MTFFHRRLVTVVSVTSIFDRPKPPCAVPPDLGADPAKTRSVVLSHT